MLLLAVFGENVLQNVAWAVLGFPVLYPWFHYMKYIIKIGLYTLE